MRLAANLARTSQAALVIAHTWHIPDLTYAAGGWMMPPDAREDLARACETNLARTAADARQLGVPNVSTILLEGPPVDRITKLLRDDHGFDLVVAGTHGTSSVKRVLLGSVAEHVVRHAPCSVLVSRERLEDVPFRSVLCPVDFSRSSRHAMQLAASLARPGGTGIELLHAIDLPAAYQLDFALTDAFVELQVSSTRQLGEWAAGLREQAKVPVTTKVTIGRAGAEVLRALDATTFDLVVAGSHSRTGVSRALLGSVAEKIVRHAWCPVLVAREREH